MARINGNIITDGITGMIAKQVVLKTRFGKRYAAGPPTTDPNRKPTPAQKFYQDKMRDCNAYAKEAIKDEELKAAYKAAATGGQTAVNVACKDAWNPPVVQRIILNAYKGMAGDLIFIHATDDFKVAIVGIGIYSTENLLIEQGTAVDTGDGVVWMYTATVTCNNFSKIVAKAYDLPWNKGEKEHYFEVQN